MSTGGNGAEWERAWMDRVEVLTAALARDPGNAVLEIILAAAERSLRETAASASPTTPEER